jgi:acyl carrier protein
MNDKLIQIFARELNMDPALLNDETSPDNTKEWDSLAALNLVIAIEYCFNIKMTTKMIMKSRSIGLVREMLRSKGIQDV